MWIRSLRLLFKHLTVMYRFTFQLCGFVLLVRILAGCADKEEDPAGNGAESIPANELQVRITPQEYIDSALVFFFRPVDTTDTLVLCEKIYGVEFFKPKSFSFEVPAGKYSVWLYGNVPDDCLIAKAPYSSADFYFDYSDGRKPAAVTYGRSEVNSGVDTVNLAGMLLLASSVQLTINQMPAGIDRVIVRLLNTSAGINLAGGYLDKGMDPPLSDTLYQVEADSIYLVHFYCFPGKGTDGKSILDVDCLGVTGQTVYSGRSAPFEARPGYNYNIACSFADTAIPERMNRNKPGMIYFREEER